MFDEIYPDSLSAWEGLCKIGGIEPGGRDCDLVSRLKDVLDPEALDLHAALVNTSTNSFLQALFQVIQPFSMMFRDVLSFFEKAGARTGRNQWKISIQDELVDLKHFEEFLDLWEKIDHVEVPALHMHGAFFPTEIRIGPSYDPKTQTRTGIVDVDTWLSEYEKDRYAELPPSLQPAQMGPDLEELSRIVMAALSVIRTRGLDRGELLSARGAGRFNADPSDAFNLGSIAQNETDFWLPDCILHLTALSKKTLQEQKSFGVKLKAAYAEFPRRRVGVNTRAKDLARLLALPAWEKRHEFYGVWVATEMVRALDAHKVMVNHANEELRFAFTEAKIADVKTAQPEIALFGERRTRLDDPVGKGRKNSVQPDLTLWTKGEKEECILVVEVKHYKRRSARNFRDALIDYARAHPLAEVLLVNYGPVGPAFTNLPEPIDNRCRMIGGMNPENPLERQRFHKAVRTRVGGPVTQFSYAEHVARQKILVIDVSRSMKQTLTGSWFTDFVQRLEKEHHNTDLVLVDNSIRAVVPPDAIQGWLANSQLGHSTSLTKPISTILENHANLIIVTDREGLQDLSDSNFAITQLPTDADSDVTILLASKPA